MIIAHDLKNPFNSLLGFAELLSKRYDKLSDEKRKSIIEILLNSSKNLFELLTNLLNWSRAQRGSIIYNAAMADIICLIRENIELIQNQADQKQIRIILEIPFEKLILKIDTDLINAVIRNLLTNAVKYTDFAGKITVTGNITNDNFTVSIADTGIGIPKEGIMQLFRKDSYYTTYGTNNERGTGLGLIVCKEFVEMHMGKIWIANSDEKGSTFCFMLPLSV
jgi:signal transduction histidine kinase